MAKRQLRNRALELRILGWSYSQIKKELGVSKGSLSLWLKDYPLSEERIRELRDNNAQRIERYRTTRRKKREERLSSVQARVAHELSTFSRREFVLAGLFLYWGEGGKTRPVTTCLSNTDPAMLRFYINWLILLGAALPRIRVHIHLYADMDPSEELNYWSEELGLPLSNFLKPYIKTSNRIGLTYKQRFTHGTCNVLYHNRDISEFVLTGLEYVRERLGGEEGGRAV